MTAGRLARLEALEAKAAHRGGVVIVWPDGVRDGWGRSAKVEGAAVRVVMPAHALTPAQIEAARRAEWEQ